jgi:DNA-binding NarL/FixJ family response regulator
VDNEWVPYLHNIPAASPLMWISDLQADVFIDMTPATARFMETHDLGALPRTLSLADHMEAAHRAVETGESTVLIEWVKYDGAWHKLMRTKSPVGDFRVLDIAQDITHLDPRADWLARINLDTQRLELESGQSFSFDEFVVLHMLLKGLQYKQIAETLNISPKTVEYRLSRLKDALGVETILDLLHVVTSSGLVLLAMVPVDPANPAMTEVELYRKIPG